MLLVVALPVAMVVLLVRRPVTGGSENAASGLSATRRSSAYDVLDPRYARGEIDAEEYQARIATLDNPRGSRS
jgi:putative membrane protein